MNKHFILPLPFLASLALAAACSTTSPTTGSDAGSTTTTDSSVTPGADSAASDSAAAETGPGPDSAVADAGTGTCTYGGNTYAVGETFPATDGCNSCQCVAHDSVACTKLLCVDAAADGGYTCPKDGTINCMPIVPPANVPLCTGPYHAWIVANCPGVMFVF